ncbi:FAD-binding oxidoreductase [Aggregicoccus sp. 17bor-14]|uniref:FAD-binding oxidoreductase n=1 Tax=Myxococcaceae TaxID=31 RepID=UPI00129C60FE|nr:MULTISPECIES: FAD-binding oxidoreductase [Myxococcaceae]MBF5041849.1 FAD-binding oxidoreductase [Simulacricoccus sp. 17bor-14]MRI87630.1 FAD-binding oxidoreductase [Aggregicoccus sp. 17bor-14]
MSKALQSWGRYPRVTQRAHPLVWVGEPLPQGLQGPLLPYGQGRSYGDSCLNPGGTVLTTAGLDRFLGFDPASGVLTCEAGVTLEDILRLATWQGWFLPVTPGTKFVSVGGAIANDVHGKNHHRMGTFGRHVRRFELLRSDGRRLVCSPTENADWYAATIGGLGLTGVILWAEVQLRRMSNPYIQQDTLPFANLDGFFQAAAESDADFEYTVAWVDCLSRGRKLGRGLYFRGNHAPPQFDALPLAKSHLSRKGGLSVPFDLPSFTLNRLTVAAFNALYYGKNRLGAGKTHLTHYDPFFYPLDSVHAWNRIYGRRGFLQFQCVVPHEVGGGAMREILERIAASRLASFLAVLKKFGSAPSPGLLSFPRPGVTLALDFANAGERTYRLFHELERVTREAGGAVYPAKDARMEPETFQASFPQVGAFARFVDPAFSSAFWRRVKGADAAAAAR